VQARGPGSKEQQQKLAEKHLNQRLEALVVVHRSSARKKTIMVTPTPALEYKGVWHGGQVPCRQRTRQKKGIAMDPGDANRDICPCLCAVW